MDTLPDPVSDVVDRLKALPKKSTVIASEAGVPLSWLHMFRRGEISNPGVRQFRKIVEYLDGQAA